MNYLQKDPVWIRSLLDRFLAYVKTWSTSDSKKADNGIIPSTDQQKFFALRLCEEMKDAGLSGVTVTEYSYVYGYLPASRGYEQIPPFCLMAHMDTVEEVSGKDVHPNVIENYTGEKIYFENGIELDPGADLFLAQAGRDRDTIITSDGTTLLGADDKAGLAAIMTAALFLKSVTEVKHGKIELLFSPDEETGHGMDKVPRELLNSKRCYTVDGGHIGELETECFNACRSDITFTGKATHTGTARAGGMINAITMAGTFLKLLPGTEAPETTDGYTGFYVPMSMSGSIENSHLTLFLRDFTTEGMEKRKELVKELAQAAAHAAGGQVQVVHTVQYMNMKQKLDQFPEVVEDLYEAFQKAGIQPVNQPIRGGTDGARLTEMGIPTPNIFTGGHNYHSRTEWASLSQMSAATEVLIQLAVTIASRRNQR